MSAEGRVRLTVLGGYLGSGKTTWLRHQLHAGAYRDALILVNEAAETPVDDALLTEAAGLEVLAGGCACCAGRDALVALLRRLADTRSRVRSDDARLDHILLETSGLADPGAIVAAIRADPVLVHHMVVTEIVVAVDALHGAAQLAGEALGRRQVETADRLVVTKVDAAAPDDVARLVATLARLNPGAAVSGAAKGDAHPLPDHAEAEPIALPALSADDAPIFTTRLTLDERIDWPAFTVWLSALLHARGDDVVRVKGVVRTPAGRLLLQSVRRVVQAPERLPDTVERGTDDTIVVIGRGYRGEDLARSLARFAGAG
ncbi:CobW family GTP-binding protein [Prosthecomicrobium pneumaticum]|uniref:G3E family GTPase n=1 Tax=Prosthecomicrobium pneumaticum TaxID=81895 RepID=A0A7W9CU34_9HYPH|nr:GTP-binding protein [Prosthecomicrobium pneumaticum]MBB5751920.1 G3E family GTPase [Prosthecomicrobium pneumaticum]